MPYIGTFSYSVEWCIDMITFNNSNRYTKARFCCKCQGRKFASIPKGGGGGGGGNQGWRKELKAGGPLLNFHLHSSLSGASRHLACTRSSMHFGHAI